MQPSEKKRPGGKALESESGSRGRASAHRHRIRILVAEDHTVVRDGLIAILEKQPDMEVVAEAGDGRRAVELWTEHRPHVTLMDLRMPGLDGVDAIEAIRAADPDARIVILTTFDGDEDIYRGMRAGAKSYLLKGVRHEELLRCIREVHAGGMVVPPAIGAKLALHQPAEELSRRESEVLRLLAEGKPNRLIGAALSISEVTVKSHVQRIFRKLNVLSRTEAVAVASRKGLLRL